ncbi:MAG: M48 family metallopeptidase [Opitutales bacterium]
MRISLLLLPVLLGLGLAGCHTVPQTGRSALHLMPASELAAMSAQQFGKLKAETPISNDPDYNERMQRVGERIAYVADEDIPNADWEFVVFEDDEQMNAFAMPGGKVAIYTGLFDIIQSDDDLAVVIGHEVAHVAAGHGNERVSQQMLATGGAFAFQLGTKDMDSSDRQLIMAAYGAGTTIGILLPYSRFHESEADEIGLMYTAKAGYDPREAIDFWQRMENEKNGSPPEFLSTHPTGQTRMQRLRRIMPEAMEAYRKR